MQHVTIVGFRKTLGTSITIPMEMLNAADLINRIKGAGYRKLHMQLVSPDGGNIALNAGLELVCKTKLSAVERTDLVIVPALWGNPRGVIIRQMFSLQSWKASRSVETTHVRTDASSARVAIVAITSSASHPSNSRFR